jgi:hypothetical protein
MPRVPNAAPPAVEPTGGPAKDFEARSRAACWTKPVLTVHGDVRALTMGPTPGLDESGSPLTLQIPT